MSRQSDVCWINIDPHVATQSITPYQKWWTKNLWKCPVRICRNTWTKTDLDVNIDIYKYFTFQHLFSIFSLFQCVIIHLRDGSHLWYTDGKHDPENELKMCLQMVMMSWTGKTHFRPKGFQLSPTVAHHNLPWVQLMRRFVTQKNKNATQGWSNWSPTKENKQRFLSGSSSERKLARKWPWRSDPAEPLSFVSVQSAETPAVNSNIDLKWSHWTGDNTSRSVCRSPVAHIWVMLNISETFSSVRSFFIMKAAASMTC